MGPPAMNLRLDIAVAAPVWHALSYAIAPELAGLVRPLTRVMVPLRGRLTLGFALGPPEEGDPAGLRATADVLDEPGCPAFAPAQLGFFRRAAAYYQTPLGQALAWALPAGLGGKDCAVDLTRPPGETVLQARLGPGAARPKPDSRAGRLLARLEAEGPSPLGALREEFPAAAALARALEKAGWLSVSHRPLVKDLLGRPLWPEPRPSAYTPDQREALAKLLPAVAARRFEAFLLYGVTGSGKTEVYLAACEEALRQGRGALVLTPEIGLSLRLEGLLRDRLGPGLVAVLHSGLTPAARRAQWRAIAAGQARVVVGARSAVFAPLADPGAICVDEEQDEAYKQEDRLRYHGRDLALLRAQEESCPALLGTATPAVTTWQRARAGELTLLSLPRRIGQAQLPRMEVVDLRRAGRLEAGFLSGRLKQALADTLAQGRQAVLFLNRRGFAPAFICGECGKTVGCPACSLSLSLHQERGLLICHTCGHQRPLPTACPNCGAPAEGLKPLGLGTESVAARLAELMPGLRLARLDRDTAATPAQLRQILRQVAEHQVDVVVGTQMIGKGHHFPLIGLVGVLMADQALALPDFRAAERAYALLTQVAGRAGRGGGPGLVIVQTFDPDHHAIRAAIAHRPDLFYETELEERRALGYPPFMRLMLLRLEGMDEAATARAAKDLCRRLEEARRRLAPEARLLGPAPAPVARVQSRWRQIALLKAPRSSALGAVLRQGLHLMEALPSGVRLAVDVDPISLV